MRACFLSIPAMFESIHPSFSILITPPQGLSAPPTESLLPSLLAPHRVGWQERRHRQQGVGRACQRVPPPRWVTGIRALLWSVYALYPSGRTLRRRGDSGPGGKVAPAIWRQRAGSTRPRGENKQVPRVLVLPLWPTSKQCVSMWVCVCTCADEELGLSNTQFHFVQGYGHLQGGCNGEKETDRKRARFIIVVLIGNTKYFQQWRDVIMHNCFQKAASLLAVQSISFFPSELLLTEQNFTERVTSHIVNMKKRPLANMHECNIKRTITCLSKLCIQLR